MCAYNFGGSGRNLRKLYQGMWLVAVVLSWTLILQEVTIQNFIGQKFGAIFWQLSNLIEISEIWKTDYQPYFTPIGRKFVNFGPSFKTCTI